MWLLRNATPYAVERNWTRDARGVHWWLVAVRATFEVAPGGELKLADEQLPPTLEPQYSGEAGASSLRCDSDLLDVKPTTDILVLGHAHAPRGRPASTVPIVLRAGPIEKQIVVHGSRVYFDGMGGLTTTTARPFVTSPIVYEHAWGGAHVSDPDPAKHEIDERNPVGRGFPARASVQANQPAHTIEYASGSAASKGPAGFGPIDRGWLPRRRLAGTYDAEWVHRKKPLLPDDYDPRFGLSAPVDQRPDAPLRGGERVGVLNMTPDGTLTFEVPRVALRFSTKIGRSRKTHGPRIATLLVEPDDRRVSVVWQSAIEVAARDVDHLESTDITEARGSA